jgi:hypothetical protein
MLTPKHSLTILMGYVQGRQGALEYECSVGVHSVENRLSSYLLSKNTEAKKI